MLEVPPELLKLFGGGALTTALAVWGWLERSERIKLQAQNTELLIKTLDVLHQSNASVVTLKEVTRDLAVSLSLLNRLTKKTGG